jgi:hypothetical protein
MQALRQRPSVHSAFEPRLRPRSLATAVSHGRRTMVKHSSISTHAAFGGADMEVASGHPSLFLALASSLVSEECCVCV